MSNIYEVKIQKHVKFDTDDIKKLCIDLAKKNNLSDYVTKFIIDKVFSGIAGYSDELSLICLDTNFINHYKNFKKVYQSKNMLDRILVLDADVFNLFIIETIYHEIFHAKQKKELDNNPNSYYATLIAASKLFKPKSGSTYHWYHDRYFFEYDANISSILFTINYIKDFDFDKRALFLLNRSWADGILRAYGIDLGENTYSTYKCPIDFFRFFFDEKFPIYDHEKPIFDRLENSISNYKPDDDINSLIRGYPIPDTFIEKLINIASGKDNTTNILSELYSITKQKYPKK